MAFVATDRSTFQPTGDAALFLDTGSVWDDGASHKLRASTGFGFHTEHVFLTVAFPLNAPGTDAAFMMGVRF